MNVATDIYGWEWVAKVIPILAVLVWMVPDILWMSRAKTLKKSRLYFFGFKVCLLILSVLALFMFFGPGERIENPDAETDGHRTLVESRPAPPTESIIKEEAKAKKDPYLKAMDEGPEAARKEADEYLRKALEKSK